MESVGRTLIVANPRAVRLRRSGAWEAINRAVDGERIVLVTTEYAGHAGDYCRQHAGDFDKIIAAGGDGLIMDVVNGSFGSGAAVAPLAAGSGSDFAKALPGYPADLSRLLATEAILNVDLGKVTFADGGSHYFVTEAGTGIDAACVRYIPNWLRPIRASLAYDIGALRAILRCDFLPARVELDDDELTFDRLQLLAVCNTRYFGDGMPVAPDAEVDDGLFHVFIVANASRIEILRSFTQLRKGTHIHHPKVVYRSCRRVRLHTEVDSDACLDGDLFERSPRLWEVLPGALRVIDPAG